MEFTQVWTDFLLILVFVRSILEILKPECSYPLGIFGVVELTMYFTLRLLSELSSRIEALKGLFDVVMVICLIVNFPVSIVGFIWTFSENLSPNMCLNGAAFVSLYMLFGINFFAYIFIFAVMVSLCRAKRQSGIDKQFLDHLYENPSMYTQIDFKEFIRKRKILLTSQPLHKAEEKLLSELCQSESTEEGQCTICLGDIPVGGTVCQVGCVHKFHTECLVSWYSVKPQCPLCRKPFRPYMLRKFWIREQKLEPSAEEERQMRISDLGN